MISLMNEFWTDILHGVNMSFKHFNAVIQNKLHSVFLSSQRDILHIMSVIRPGHGYPQRCGMHFELRALIRTDPTARVPDKVFFKVGKL